MASIRAMRQAIADNLSTVDGLRTAAIIPEDPKPPVAVVIFDRIEYDSSFGRALDMYLFKVVLVLGRVNTRGTEEALDGYLSGSGSTSLKAAIESDRSLGGEIQDLRVTSGENVRELVVADITYVAADFLITVYA